MKLLRLIWPLIIPLFFCPKIGQAAEVEVALSQSLKTEASHDQNRSAEFKKDQSAKKIFSTEREKGLASFLEEQEKWDMLREKGIAEHRRQKTSVSPIEGGPEYQQDQKLKKIEADKMEAARQLRVQTREQILAHVSPAAGPAELEELGLDYLRPRYDVRKRGLNKWIKKTPSAGQTSKGSGAYGAPPAAFDDYPIQPDYVPAPIQGFEEIPPPPPVDFDGANSGLNGFPYNGNNIDSGFGDIPPPPPPPPVFLDD